LDIPLLV